MRPNKGFILIYVIVVLSLMAVYAALLADGTRSLVLQTNRAQLKAIERNLQLSALAWTEHHPAPAEHTQLDVTKLTSRPARLDISLRPGNDNRREVSITTQCVFGRQSHEKTISVQVVAGADK